MQSLPELSTDVRSTPWLAGRTAAPVVQFLMGPPASGKSHFAKTLMVHCPDWAFVGSDATRLLLYGDEAIEGDIREVFDSVYGQLQRATAKRIVPEAQRGLRSFQY